MLTKLYCSNHQTPPPVSYSRHLPPCHFSLAPDCSVDGKVPRRARPPHKCFVTFSPGYRSFRFPDLYPQLCQPVRSPSCMFWCHEGLATRLSLPHQPAGPLPSSTCDVAFLPIPLRPPPRLCVRMLEIYRGFRVRLGNAGTGQATLLQPSAPQKMA